jgi:hypothetical protein
MNPLLVIAACGLTAFSVEVTREVSYVEYAKLVVYAHDAEEAKALAQARAEQANAITDYDCPFNYGCDDGDQNEWVAQDAEPATDEDLIEATGRNTINEPEEDEG